ncbi:MAG TPA: hypothetical protein PLB91_13205, partial [Spirochaetales bacterium]|nr:hypothetical protein [Spirochaetales bacterium]
LASLLGCGSGPQAQRPYIEVPAEEADPFAGPGIELHRFAYDEIRPLAGDYRVEGELLRITGSQEAWSMLYFDRALPESYALSYELRLDSGDPIVAEAMLNTELVGRSYTRAYAYHFARGGTSYFFGKGIWGKDKRGGPDLVNSEDHVPQPASMKRGRWARMEILRIGNLLEMRVEGKTVLSYYDDKGELGRGGYLGFLANAGISLRNIELRYKAEAPEGGQPREGAPAPEGAGDHGGRGAPAGK